MDDVWEGAFEDDVSQRRPLDDHVQILLNFVQEHESILKNIERTTKNSVSESLESHYRPIRIVSDPTEKVYPQDLIVAPNNELLRKVITVLVFLCDEIHELKDIAEKKIFGPIIVFGQNPPEKNENVESATLGSGVRERMVGKFLPHLQETANFIERCYSVATNVVQQLASLMKAKEQLYKATFQGTHLCSVFNTLSELLVVLVTLDNIIQQNEFLQESWSYYKSMISYARGDPSSFGTDEVGISKFERLLVSIDQAVMIGEIFKGCIEQNFEIIMLEEEEEKEVKVNVRANEVFMGELLFCFKTQLETALSIIGTSSELFERYDIVGSMAMYCLYRQLLLPSVPPDSKLHKTLWGVQKIVPLVILCERVEWHAGEFLQTYAPLEMKKPDPPNPQAYRRGCVQQFGQTLNQRAAVLASQCAAWMVLTESRLQASMRHDTDPKQVLDVRGSILLKGVALANRAQYLAKSCLVMHAVNQVPMTRANLMDVALLVENLKAMECTFSRKDSIVGETQSHIIRVLSCSILDIIKPVRMKLEGQRKMDPSRLDIMSVLEIIESMLRSSDTLSFCRLAALQIAGEILFGSKHIAEKDTQRLRSSIRRLVALSSLPKDVVSICDTKFLFYHLDILKPIVASIYQQPTEANRLQYVIGAFADGVKVCEIVLHMDKAAFYLSLRDVIRQVIKREIVEPLCRDIETDLRLHIHTKHLDHMQALNPKTDTLRPLRPFLEISPLRVLGIVVNIKSEVEHYLDRTFYNLTTVALHDWRTYSDMRSLAEEKLGLSLMDNFLPMGSLDQGLDVLQIMRNIHIFVGRFAYNMNMQQFVEFRPDKSSKHLNTIKIQSIAASIRQHGLGVLNTTVNFTYQFLAQKFHIFSQFLYDDYIRAHLSREHRWYKKHKNEEAINNMCAIIFTCFGLATHLFVDVIIGFDDVRYPHDRALKFVRDIRKLGVNEAGKTFLDQFRVLITEIGNALGYVRMVRSASMYYCSEAVKFLPELDDTISFKRYSGSGEGKKSENSGDDGTAAPADDTPDVSGANLSSETVRSAHNLDEVISTLVKNFGEGSDYFKVLVKVFQSVLLTSEHDHLKVFYMIVPSLCISWVEASLQAKDAMYKATRGVTKEMYFTDDGFAMGVAYCLAILKQTRKNEALHWVDTVRIKYRADLKQLEQQQKSRALKEQAAKEKKEKEEKAKRGFFSFLSSAEKPEEEEEDFEDYEEVHTLQMTAKRLEAHRRETEQLFYSMTGAGIFFKRTDVDT